MAHSKDERLRQIERENNALTLRRLERVQQDLREAAKQHRVFPCILWHQEKLTCRDAPNRPNLSNVICGSFHNPPLGELAKTGSAGAWYCRNPIAGSSEFREVRQSIEFYAPQYDATAAMEDFDQLASKALNAVRPMPSKFHRRIWRVVPQNSQGTEGSHSGVWMSMVFEISWQQWEGQPPKVAWDERGHGFDLEFAHGWHNAHIDNLHWYSPLGSAFDASVDAIDVILTWLAADELDSRVVEKVSTGQTNELNAPARTSATHDEVNQAIETERLDFFISYSQVDRPWAEWIAWQLEEANYTTVIQAWDSKASANFVQEMHEAATRAHQTVAVLSPDYLKSKFSQAEWQAAFVQDPTGEEGKLLPVRVCECEPRGLLRSIVYIDLVGREEVAAQRELLSQIQKRRMKPIVRPAFPGGYERVGHSAFPGAGS